MSLFLEEIVEGLTMTVHHLWSGAASLFFHEYFGLEKRAEIICTFICHAILKRLCAFVAGGGIKVKAITARMQIRITVLALIRNLDLIHYLDFRGAVIAARNLMKFGFDSAPGSLGAPRRLGLPFPILVHIAGLTIFPGHFAPYIKDDCLVNRQSMNVIIPETL